MQPLKGMLAPLVSIPEEGRLSVQLLKLIQRLTQKHEQIFTEMKVFSDLECLLRLELVIT